MKIYYFSTLILIYSCAQIGSPQGGVKDVIPPKLLYASPAILSKKVNTNIKEIHLHFDELILLKDQSKEIIISPPIKKPPLILPNTFASNEVLIRFRENLTENTTYSINFGESLRDNNEGNILSNFSYVFSTGDTIDNLKINGRISNYIDNTYNSNIIVGLYQADSVIDFTKKPYYISKTDNTGNYKFQNLKNANYEIIAFNDENFNKVFDEDNEQIAFLKDVVNLNENKTINLKLSKVQNLYNLKQIKQKGFGEILVEVTGKPSFLSVEVLDTRIKEVNIVHQIKSDSLYLWFNPLNIFDEKEKQSEIKFILKNQEKIDTLSLMYSFEEMSKFNLEKKTQELIPKKKFSLTFNRPIRKINPNKIFITNNKKNIPFKYDVLDSNPTKLYLNFPIILDSHYDIELHQEAISDIFDIPNNPIKFSYQTLKEENFGKLILQLINPPKNKFFLELLKDGNLIEKIYSNEAYSVFEYLIPGEYSFRILVDENENGFYDLADFKNKIPAEKTYLYSKTILVRPMWEVKETWEIKND